MNPKHLLTIRAAIKRSRVLTLRKFSSQELSYYLKLAYKKALWCDYLPMYQTLFTSESEAIEKAKTHSLGLMCKWLRNQSGCSYSILYKSIKDESSCANIFVSPDVLDISDKLHFIFSLGELDTNPAQDEADFQ